MSITPDWQCWSMRPWSFFCCQLLVKSAVAQQHTVWCTCAESMLTYPALNAVEGVHALEGWVHPGRQLLDLHDALVLCKRLGLQRRHVDLLEALHDATDEVHNSVTVSRKRFSRAEDPESCGAGQCIRTRSRVTAVSSTGQKGGHEEQSLRQATFSMSTNSLSTKTSNQTASNKMYLVCCARGARGQVGVLVGVQVPALRKGQPLEVHRLAAAAGVGRCCVAGRCTCAKRRYPPQDQHA